MKRIALFFLTIVAIIVLDQVTKNLIIAYFRNGESLTIIEGFFNLTYVKNSGAAFGMFANVHEAIRKPMLFFIPVVACFFLIYLMKQVWKKNIVLEIAYSLILAGAVGNLIDRFSMNYVVDFFDFYVGVHHFPAFNVADSSISVAVGFLILDLILSIPKNKKKHVSKEA